MSEEKKAARVDAAKAMALADMIAYQEGSVVSRILLQDDTGGLTVFAFDKGQALSEHTVAYNAVIEVLDGVAEITIGGERVEVKAGEIVLMPGGVPHKVDAPERFKMLLTMFKKSVA